MITLFKGWRRKSGIMSLILASVVAGAWIKSSFDKSRICCSNGNRVDEISMAGKVGVFCSSHSIEIMGLYREELTLILPHQLNTEPARPMPARDAVDFSIEIPPPWAMFEDAAVTPVSYQEEASNAEGFSSSVSWNQSDAKPLQVEKRIGVTLDLDKQIIVDSDGNTWAMDSELANQLAEAGDYDEGLTTSKSQAFGFYSNWTKSRDGGWNTSFVVPHWAIVMPLVLLSIVLLCKPLSFRMSFRTAKTPVLT